MTVPNYRENAELDEADRRDLSRDAARAAEASRKRRALKAMFGLFGLVAVLPLVAGFAYERLGQSGMFDGIFGSLCVLAIVLFVMAIRAEEWMR